jgi:hypothetical protein
MFKSIAMLYAALTLSACASVSSKHLAGGAQTKSDSGLVYRLPKRGINITVTFETDKPPVVAIQEGTSFGDPNAVYVADVHRNPVGKVASSITVSTNGLLTSTTAKYSNQIDALFDAWKGTKTPGGQGTRQPVTDKENEKARQTCPKTGTVHFTVYLQTSDGDLQSNAISPDSRKELPIAQGCPDMLKLLVSRAFVQTKPSNWAPPGHSPANGYFYRLNMPYVVSATINDITTQYIALLPDESDAYFVKLPSALFADTDNTTTFVDGVLTVHSETTDSELISLLKIPADLIRSYASAIGSVFDSFRKRDLAESRLDAQDALNQYNRLQFAACLKAIQSGADKDTTKAACTIQVPAPASN